MAKTFPLDAKSIALEKGISFAKAVTKASSELNGIIVAAKKAEKKRANSVI